jgi:hypothetical protein
VVPSDDIGLPCALRRTNDLECLAVGFLRAEMPLSKSMQLVGGRFRPWRPSTWRRRSFTCRSEGPPADTIYILTAELDSDTFTWLDDLRRAHFLPSEISCPIGADGDPSRLAFDNCLHVTADTYNGLTPPSHTMVATPELGHVSDWREEAWNFNSVSTLIVDSKKTSSQKGSHRRGMRSF